MVQEEQKLRDIKGETSESAQTMPPLKDSLTPSDLGQVTYPLKIPLKKLSKICQ